MGKIRLVEVVAQPGPHTPRPPQPGSPVWMSIDISRTKLVFCVRWGGAEQRRLSTPMGLEHVRALVEQYRDCRLHVAYEACGFGYEIAWWLQAQAVATTVIAPSRVERAPGPSVKTDRLDVGKMARKLEKAELKPIYIPSHTIHEQRAFGHTYAQCVKERKRAQVRIRALMQEHSAPGAAAGARLEGIQPVAVQSEIATAARQQCEGPPAVAHLGRPAGTTSARATRSGGGQRALREGGQSAVRTIGCRNDVGDPLGVGTWRHPALSHHGLAASLLGTDTERVQLRGRHQLPRAHHEMWTGDAAAHLAAVCVGGGAPGSRPRLGASLRTLGTLDRAQASDRGGGAPLGDQIASTLVAGPVAYASGRLAGVGDFHRPHGLGGALDFDTLREQPWSAMLCTRWPTSDSLAEIDTRRAVAAATDHNLVSAPAGAYTNSRLAPRSVCVLVATTLACGQRGLHAPPSARPCACKVTTPPQHPLMNSEGSKTPWISLAFDKDRHSRLLKGLLWRLMMPPPSVFRSKGLDPPTRRPF